MYFRFGGDDTQTLAFLEKVLYYVKMRRPVCLRWKIMRKKDFAIFPRIRSTQYRFGWEPAEISLCIHLKLHSNMKIIHYEKHNLLILPKWNHCFISISINAKIHLNLTDNDPWTSISWCAMFSTQSLASPIYCNRFQIKFDTKDIQSFIELKQLESSQLV